MKARPAAQADCRAGVCRHIEKLGLLTKAEKFGLLSTLERLLTSDPAAVSSLSIPALVTALGAAWRAPQSRKRRSRTLLSVLNLMEACPT